MANSTKAHVTKKRQTSKYIPNAFNCDSDGPSDYKFSKKCVYYLKGAFCWLKMILSAKDQVIYLTYHLMNEKIN